MKYKAIFSDVDDTLVVSQSDEAPSERVIQAIFNAKKAGVHFGLATGRPVEARGIPHGDRTGLPSHITRDLFKILNLQGPSITSGGAEIIESSTKEIIRESIIPATAIDPICKLIQSFNVGYWIQDNGGDYIYNSNYTPYKPYVICVDKLTLQQADTIGKACSAFPEIEVYKAPVTKFGFVMLNITNKGATKGTAIAEAIKMLGLKKEEVIGIGDGYNDLPLLNACGFKVAMADSVPEMLAIADYVTDNVENDGMAKMIEKFILL